MITSCYDQLKAGRCEKSADCAAGLACSQEMTAGVYHRCVPVDAGSGGADGGDAGDSGKPECDQNQQCPAERPVCSVGGLCAGCDTGAPTVCATLHPSRPVCGPDGACVQCAASSDCVTAAKAVCDLQSNTCVPCAKDSDCAGRPGPGVCMAHQDGRCATDAETIYVQQIATCADTADLTAGTVDRPFCGFDKAAVGLSPGRRLFVTRGTVQGTAWTIQGSAGDLQISIVGQQNAVVAGGASPGLRMVMADVFVRDLAVRRSEQIGISATNGATLHLQRVSVENNGGGGILLDGSAFGIQDSIVVGNGPGVSGPITWGGLLIQNPPSTGPARLERVTISDNIGTGASCTGPIEGLGVLATGNTPIDLSPTCAIASCGTPSATCGAM